jgi:hypothetical protein
VIDRILDIVAVRAWFVSRLFLGIGILFAAYYWIQLTTSTMAPVDVHAYWVADPNNLYPPADSPLHRDAYLYSPAFELVVGWGRRLDFEAFASIWRAILLLTLVWLAGPLTALVLFTIPVASEVNAGNIQLLLAAAIVLSFRGMGADAGVGGGVGSRTRWRLAWPATWAFVLLTKLTPGVGLLWFGLRREWRALAVALAATLAIAAVTFAIWPERWLAYVGLLTGGGTPSPLSPYYLPFWPRIAAAIAIVAIGAWRGWRWPVVVAGTLALPAFYTISPSMLVGVLPFAREAFGRWAAGRRALTAR